MTDIRLGTGELLGKIHPEFKRRFAIFQIAANAVEARFEDGSRPVRTEVRRMVSEELAKSLAHAMAGAVTLECPRLEEGSASLSQFATRWNQATRSLRPTRARAPIKIRSAFAGAAFQP